MSTVLSFRSRTFAVVAAIACTFAALISRGGVAAAHPLDAGAVYTLSNSPTNNQVLAFARGQDRQLTPAGAFDTDGLGTGASLGSQGALALSDDARLIVAVNAGSDSVSLLRVRPDGLDLLDTEPSQGTRPVSVAIDHDLVYVVNDGTDNIAGFRIDRGRLDPLAGSVESLPAGSAPGQISITEDGRVVLVTVKNFNLLVTFRLDHHGAASAGVATPSAAPTPFGFALDRHGRAFVSEAPGSDLSSYQLGREGNVQLIDGPVPDGQSAACWVALSRDQRFAFASNAGNATISAYAISKDGTLTLVHPVAGHTVGGPQDLAVSDDGRYLYAVSLGAHTITEFSIEHDGSLTAIGSVSDLAMGAANGLVAK